MGEDNLESLPKWKNYEQLIAHHELIVYPRVFRKEEYDQYLQDSNIHLVKAPIVELSATEIRNMIKAGKMYVLCYHQKF